MSFSIIEGHRHQIEFLKHRLKERRLPPALLLCGPKGIGKRTLAVELAKALVCALQSDEACDRCLSCVKVSRHTHPDFWILSPDEKDHIGIGDLRRVFEGLHFCSKESPCQVVLVDDAECMGDEAQNAFLKMLEEPPPSVYFILIGSDEDGLIPTVRSRCYRIPFQPLRTEEVKRILMRIAPLGEKEAEERSAYAQGSLHRWKEWDGIDPGEVESKVFSLVGFMKQEGVCPIPDLDRDSSNQLPWGFLLDRWIEILRDLLILKSGLEAASRLFYPQRLPDFEETAKRFSWEEILRMLEEVIGLREDAEHSMNPRLLGPELFRILKIRIF